MQVIWLKPVVYEADDYSTYHENDVMHSGFSGQRFFLIETETVLDAFDSDGKAIASDHGNQYGNLIGLTFQQVFTHGDMGYIFVYRIVDRFPISDRFVIERIVVPLPPPVETDEEPTDEK